MERKVIKITCDDEVIYQDICKGVFSCELSYGDNFENSGEVRKLLTVGYIKMFSEDEV